MLVLVFSPELLIFTVIVISFPDYSPQSSLPFAAFFPELFVLL